MNGKNFLDEKYGSDRVNGRGLGSILDEFAELKIKEYKDQIENVEDEILDNIYGEEIIKVK